MNCHTTCAQKGDVKRGLFHASRKGPYLGLKKGPYLGLKKGIIREPHSHSRVFINDCSCTP